MKKVVKVSIGSIAFTLEEGAHSELELYLNSLETYDSQKEGGDEIVEGIEERLAELLLERGYGEKVVTVSLTRRHVQGGNMASSCGMGLRPLRHAHRTPRHLPACHCCVTV